MQRRINPWVVALTAALTFGSLTAFVGHRPSGNRWGGFYDQEHNRFGYDRGHCNGDWRDNAPAKPQSGSVTQ